MFTVCYISTGNLGYRNNFSWSGDPDDADPPVLLKNIAQ